MCPPPPAFFFLLDSFVLCVFCAFLLRSISCANQKWGSERPQASGCDCMLSGVCFSVIVHLGFYGVQKSQNQLQSEILLFLSYYTIKSIFSGVSPPFTLRIGNFPAPRSTMQA